MKVLVTVTFKPNQLRSHLLPILALPELDEVVLLADEPVDGLAKVRNVQPSSSLVKLLGRAGAKTVACTRLARQLRPAWILSYHLVPHGINASIAARLSGSRSMYHMIGGPEEWEGGGWQSDQRLLGRLPRPAPPLERMLLSAARRSTLVGTMGEHGRRRLLERGFAPDRVVVTPPSIDTERFSPPPHDAARPYDLVVVADLIPRKRLHDLLAAVAALGRSRPGLRAAIVGDGPLRTKLEHEAARLGIEEVVDFLRRRDDVEDVYRAARVFVLTSAQEGLSVALAEAMACGLPAVVTDVGELRELVHDGWNGHVVSVGDVEALTSRIGGLLDDPLRHQAASLAAREIVVERLSVAALSRLYRQLLVTDLPMDPGARVA